MHASRRLPPIAARTFTGTDAVRALPAPARTRPAAVTVRPAGTDEAASTHTVGDIESARADRPRRRVALWVDTMTEYLRPSVGTAALRVLAAAGFSAEVIGGRSQRACCGLTLFSTGQLERTRAELTRTAEVVQPYLDAGIPVVGLEPSCVAMLRGDAEALIGRRLHVLTLAEFLTEHAPGWQLPSLAGTVVVTQPHCHHRAVMGYRTDRALLERAGASVTEVGGCCGLAGDFGMTAGKADVSRKVAATALLPALDARPAEALVQADGYSCHVQIADLRGEHAQHLAELLAARL
jgi:Fe-S oxidoreductase